MMKIVLALAISFATLGPVLADPYDVNNNPYAATETVKPINTPAEQNASTEEGETRSNPTGGQVSDQEFDGLVRGSDRRNASGR